MEKPFSLPPVVDNCRAIMAHFGYWRSTDLSVPAQNMGISEDILRKLYSGEHVPSARTLKGRAFWKKFMNYFWSGYVAKKKDLSALRAHLGESFMARLKENRNQSAQAPRPSSSPRPLAPKDKEKDSSLPEGFVTIRPYSDEARALGAEIKAVLLSAEYTGRRAMELLGIRNQMYFSDLLAGREVFPIGTQRGREIFMALQKNCAEGFAKAKLLKNLKMYGGVPLYQPEPGDAQKVTETSTEKKETTAIVPPSRPGKKSKRPTPSPMPPYGKIF